MVLEETVELGDMKTAVQNSIRKLNLPGSCGKDGKNGGKKLKTKIWKGSPSNGVARAGNSRVYLAFLAPQSQESFADTTIQRPGELPSKGAHALGKEPWCPK